MTRKTITHIDRKRNMEKERKLPNDIEKRLNGPRPEKDYWLDWVNAIAEVGEWDKQIDTLRKKGYLGGENTTYNKDL